MTPDTELLDRIRRLIVSGALPAAPPGRPEPLPADHQRLPVEKGPGAACVICLRQNPECRYPGPEGPIDVHERCGELWLAHASRSRPRSRP